ncbi:MAG: rRNA maturation RNase YbeY [Mycoplasma sp.]
MIEINNCIEYTSKEINFKKLFKVINKTLRKQLKLSDKRGLVVNIVDTKEIREINKLHRSKDSITDVISFCFDEADVKSPILGEIYLCMDQAIKQANEYNHSVKREVAFLFVHGLLHLFGYDHIKPEEEKIMFELQDIILNKCKINREYND